MSDFQKKIAACNNTLLIDVMKKFNVDYPLYLGHIKCPFPAHNATGNTPSFKFYPETNSFYCWGCRAGGGSLEFVKHMFGGDFKEALNWFSKNFDLKIEASLLQKITYRAMLPKPQLNNTFNLINKIILFKQNEYSIEDSTIFVNEVYEFFVEIYDGTRKLFIK